jgi:pimeloyl-ACP methyl ester carboxylesterase
VASYVDLDGVQTWYDETDAGDPLVLLHPGGGGVDSRAFGPNIGALAPHFRTFTSASATAGSPRLRSRYAGPTSSIGWCSSRAYAATRSQPG